MKIAIGAMLCEGNSLTPVLTKYEDFDYAAGEAMYEKVAVVDMLKEKGCEIVPTIYAHALPGGAVIREDFLRLADDMLDRIPADGLDGIWLYLHGAMCVEGMGSAEDYLLKKVRAKVGYDIPISLAFDFHATLTDDVPKLANSITAYRTAPHCDREETEQRAMKLLFKCIEEKIMPQPQLARANVIICGDAVQTAEEPLKTIMANAAEMEKIPGMMSVQVFNGQPWIDEAYNGPAFAVTHESDTELAMKCAETLARQFYDARYDFKFEVEALEIDEAIEKSMAASEKTVFISDSGDNTTAGAAGDNAFVLNRLIKHGAKNVLVAGIADAAVSEICKTANIGDVLTLTVGAGLSKTSESATITGKLIHKGDVLSYNYSNAGFAATLDCGDITVVITENRAAFCRPDIFESIDLDYHKYHIVVVKLGYLFPELSADAERAILAFTPGASAERLEDMGLKNIRRPMFPFDDGFMA